MSSKDTILKKQHASLASRRVNARKRSRSRACASPGRGPLNNGLMTAAWPKTPSYRNTKAKAANNSRAQTWTGGSKVAHISDQVEEMEVDSHDASAMLSVGAFTELNVMKCHASTSQRKILPNSENDRSLKPSAGGLRSSKETIKRPNESMAIKSGPSDKEVKSKVPTESKASNIGRHSLNMPPVFIVLHVGRINFGLVSGSASGPVKIYGERIMVQMEDEITKEHLSFRIILKNVKELEASLEQQPFFLKLVVSAVQYTCKQKSVSKKRMCADANETITLDLAYETEVPSEVKTGLRELFMDKLSNIDNWKKSPVSSKDEIPSAERSLRSLSEKRKCLENGINDKGNDSRKRVASLQTNQKAAEPSIPGIHVARKALFQEEDHRQERIRSLESEAAHYQLMLGHKRLEIQHLEEQLRKREDETLLTAQEVHRELALRDNEVLNLQRQVDALQLQVKSEKDTTNALREQISDLQRAIDEKDLAIEEHKQAIVVRDNQLKEVRALATSPSKINESELREQIKRLETSLQQARTSLEETRRSKNGISEELRRSVDRATDLREQLRSEVSRSRRLETEAAAAAQQINDLISSKRTIQIELTDERERITLLERERLNSHRRIEDEINRRLEIEAELNAIRATAEEKEHLIDSLCVERENAVAEVGILKREINLLCGETTEENADALEQQVDVESHDWIIDRDEVIVHNTILGEGGWGQVKLGKFRGTDVAVKQIHQLILSPHNRRLFNREMDIASRCRHPCLLQFIGATAGDGMPLFVTELMEGDLRSYLSQQPLNDEDVLSIALDVALALNYLHKQKPSPIIHRDISSANVLIWYKGTEMHGKLSDYGAANFMRLSITKHPGASLYSAPETASGEQTTKIDMYSFGVLFCEMSIRELPVTEHREQQIALIKMLSRRQLVLRCIARNPVSRPNADEIIELLKSWKSR